MTVAWGTVRRAWASCGVLALAVFLVWQLIAIRATSDARAALGGDDRVRLVRGPGYWRFVPHARPNARSAGLVFFGGAMIDPVAYAPTVRAIARRGHPSLLVEVPWRGVFGGADGPEVIARAQAAMRSMGEVTHWVVAGHSRGASVAARLADISPDVVAGLALIASSHPRTFSLAERRLLVTRVIGTHDTIARERALESTRHNLPPATKVVRIRGGNHSQFGSYGWQPFDWPAAIGRQEQMALTVDALVDLLAAVDATSIQRLR